MGYIEDACVMVVHRNEVHLGSPPTPLHKMERGDVPTPGQARLRSSS